MPKAVQLTAYGGIDQLRIVDVPKPVPQAGEVIVRVVAAGTNPGEIAIREGKLQAMFPMDFPFGQGTDLSGYVDSVGHGVVTCAPGDEVIGWSYRRGAQAEYVATEAAHLIAKPATLDWFRAGSLYVVASTAVASVNAVALQPGDVVAISGAAGGVGSLATQLARQTGARVIGIVGESNCGFLHSLGVEAVTHGDGLPQRLRSIAPKLDAFIDLFGDGYVDLAIEFGIAPQRINTIIDFAAAQQHGTKAEGSAEAGSGDTLLSVANAIAWGELLMPLTAVYPFAALHEAYSELAQRKSRGKIVLAIDTTITALLRPK